jgi:hopanoid biosynthesis associated RND transporter like protein HpnN
MISQRIASVVAFCAAHARLVLVCSLAIAAGCGLYAALHFRLNSDINALLPANLEWRKRELAFDQQFHRFGVIDVVVEAPTPELAAAATRDLSDALAANKAQFESVENASSADFFARNAFMYIPTDALRRTAEGLVQGEPLLQDLSQDRSLRGLVAGLEDALIGLQSDKVKADDFARPLNLVSDTLDNVLAAKPASFSWRELTEGHAPAPIERRGFIEVRPVLDFKSLQPGQAAEDAIRQAAAPIEVRHEARVHLTGLVVINDEQFGSIRENAVRNAIISVLLVLLILWLALRSAKLIAALCVTVIVGLAATAAAGIALVGSFNVISIYFAVLFVGIGVDFAIQFGVRYRNERHRLGALSDALREAGVRVAAPLALAALATAAGFFSFLPTDYRGVSELGLIAGVGMLIAYVTSITVLPALIMLVNPPGEPEPLGYAALAPIDDYLARRRRPVLLGTGLVVLCLLPSLYWLRFDYNPLDLMNPNSEAIATFRDLSRDASTSGNAAEVIAPSVDAARELSARLAALPEVSGVVSIANFLPTDQDAKIPIIQGAQAKLAGVFDMRDAPAPPTDAENVDALNEGAARLKEAAGDRSGIGADAMRRLAGLMTRLAAGPAPLRETAATTLIAPLEADLTSLQASLEARPVTLEALPQGLTAGWKTPDGKVRLSVAPKGDGDDIPAMRAFVGAVLAVAPDATQGPISTLAAGDMILKSFVEAGAYALGSIAILLFITLRRVGDVLLTLIPLALAGLVTMEIMAVVGMPFNFANIIALPLLLGVGVAFKIYYIMAWREGITHLLQTPLTRAVIFSALTTATAFGSLWLSSHPGTSSMGKLLALSLLCTLAAAVVFQPILMGKPRRATHEDDPAES